MNKENIIHNEINFLTHNKKIKSQKEFSFLEVFPLSKKTARHEKRNKVKKDRERKRKLGMKMGKVSRSFFLWTHVDSFGEGDEESLHTTQSVKWSSRETVFWMLSARLFVACYNEILSILSLNVVFTFLSAPSIFFHEVQCFFSSSKPDESFV